MAGGDNFKPGILLAIAVLCTIVILRKQEQQRQAIMIKYILLGFIIFTVGVLGGMGYCRGDVYANFHLASLHDGVGYYSKDTGELTPFNQENPGFGLAYAFNNNLEIRSGGYKNSHYDNSFYIGGGVYTSTSRVISIGIVGGLVTGYANQVQNATIEYSTVQPFIMPTVFINAGPIRFEVGHIPAIGNSIALTTFTTGVRF